jgi:hypothetical protein
VVKASNFKWKGFDEEFGEASGENGGRISETTLEWMTVETSLTFNMVAKR